MKGKTHPPASGADIFFPSALKRRPISRTLVEQKESSSEKTPNALRPGISRTLVEQNRGRVAKYRRVWKKEGLVQVAFWLSDGVVKRLKDRAKKEGKKFSALADEILKEAL